MRVSLRVWIGGILALAAVAVARVGAEQCHRLADRDRDRSKRRRLAGGTVRTNPETGRVAVDSDRLAGEWTIAALPVGRYELTFELDGFKKLTRSDVLVEAGVTRQLNVTLEVGAMTEQVTVSADAPLVVANTAATYRRLDAEELTQSRRRRAASPTCCRRKPASAPICRRC